MIAELNAKRAKALKSAAYVGRVGGLAVALGIGIAVAGGQATAHADTTGETSKPTSNDAPPSEPDQPDGQHRPRTGCDSARQQALPLAISAETDSGRPWHRPHLKVTTTSSGRGRTTPPPFRSRGASTTRRVGGRSATMNAKNNVVAKADEPKGRSAATSNREG